MHPLLDRLHIPPDQLRFGRMIDVPFCGLQVGTASQQQDQDEANHTRRMAGSRHRVNHGGLMTNDVMVPNTVVVAANLCYTRCQMQPLSTVYLKMRQGFEGELDTSCYNFVGRVLRERGDLGGAVIAFYGIGNYYNHVAVETQDGRLIDERQSPLKFRSVDGRCQRADMLRAALPVPTVLALLRNTRIER